MLCNYSARRVNTAGSRRNEQNDGHEKQPLAKTSDREVLYTHTGFIGLPTGNGGVLSLSEWNRTSLSEQYNNNTKYTWNDKKNTSWRYAIVTDILIFRWRRMAETTSGSSCFTLVNGNESFWQTWKVSTAFFLPSSFLSKKACPRTLLHFRLGFTVCFQEES